MKVTFVAAALFCVFFASCKKEETDITTINRVRITPRGQVLSVQTDLNPKRIKGKIRSTTTSQAIVGANVYLYDEYGGMIIADAISNDTGGFVIDSVFVGDYDLKVAASGYDDTMVEITVPLAGEEYNVGNVYME